MSWFGWLTKSHYEVSMLDKVIGLGEFVVLLVVVFLGYASYNSLKQWWKQ